MTAHEDLELIDWLLNAEGAAGDFLGNLAAAGLHADHENYPLLRPTLLAFRNKYPKYDRGFNTARQRDSAS